MPLSIKLPERKTTRQRMVEVMHELESNLVASTKEMEKQRQVTQRLEQQESSNAAQLAAIMARLDKMRERTNILKKAIDALLENKKIVSNQLNQMEELVKELTAYDTEG